MFKKYGNNAVVGQSGGPTAAINASLAGVISGVLDSKEIDTLFGMSNGIDGMCKEKLYRLSDIFSSSADSIELLKFTPGAALGSCRFKLPDPDSDPAFYEKLFILLEKYGIGYFFYIGGNDSMDTAAKLSAFSIKNGIDLKVIGIPKTIDNDLVGTDHTPGFGSAAKFVATTFAELSRDTAVYSQKCVTVVEVMGRDAGWLTAASALASTESTDGPDLIYLPEAVFSCDACFSDIERIWEKHPDILIAVSEGVRLPDGSYLGADSTKTDKFGHIQLSGAAKVLADRVKERFNCKVRSIELNTPQRCGAHNASLTDINEAFDVGKYAVSYASAGKTGVMAGICRISDDPYTCVYRTFDVNEVANRVKRVPSEFINENGNYITDKCITYLRPLIEGECSPPYKNGIPVHYRFKKL